MYLGALTLEELRAGMNANPCPPANTEEYYAWKAALDKLMAEFNVFTNNSTRYTQTSKTEMMRAEIARQRAREPITRCMVDKYKAGRNISDLTAVYEIRKINTDLAKKWVDIATHAERNKNIKIVVTIAAIATAGAAALAAAAAAGGITTAAGLQAAAGSALGIEAGAATGFKQLGVAALKKVALSQGVDYAAKYAATEYAEHQGKKLNKAQEKALATELVAAEKEYQELLAKGKSPAEARSLASRPSGGGVMIPLGLALFAIKTALA